MPARGGTVRRLALGALLGTLIAILVIVLSSDGDGHRIKATVDEARFLIPGSQVRDSGQVIGKVAEAEPTRDGRARIELSIEDERGWPIPQGTKFRLRWSGTITFTGRYVEIDRPENATRATPSIPEDGVVPSADVISPVEVDEVFNTLNRESRADLKAMLDEGGGALGPIDDELRRTLDRAPAAVEEARAVLEDLGHDEEALDTLVRSGDRVVHEVQAANPGVGALIEDASTTFAAVASRANELERMLGEMPPTLSSARRTLAHADSTLRSASDLTRRLSPGVTQVRRLTPTLTRVLRRINQIGPDARRTLRTARRATPDLNPLLDQARSLMPTIESLGGEAAKQVACVRPYAPEVAGLAGTWNNFLRYEDNQDKYARANLPIYPFNQVPLNSGQVKQLFPGMRYGFPQPPGFPGGQPWFNPECGLGTDTVDANRDPEAR